MVLSALVESRRDSAPGSDHESGGDSEQLAPTGLAETAPMGRMIGHRQGEHAGFELHNN